MNSPTTRRAFLRTALASSSLIYFGGCCNFRRPPQISPASNRGVTFDNFLSTKKLFPNRENFRPAIDAHSHFFNATDIQAGGYLAGPVASEWGINGPLMEAGGAIVDGLARRIAPSAFAEYQYLDALEARTKNRLGIDIYRNLDRDIAIQNKLIARELFKELDKTDFPEIYRSNTRSLRASNGNFDYSEALILRVLNDNRIPIKATSRLKSRDAVQARASLSIFTFLGIMLSYRTHNIHRYRKAYFENAKNVKVVCAANAMVDFDRWVGRCDESYSTLENQIKLNDRLAKVHDNYIFNLISFNPWTAIKVGEPYYKLIESALALESFRGVKIYPPIGYYPLGNENAHQPVWPTGHPDLKRIDAEMQRLYGICLSHDVPVMAHGNHSMGAIPNFKQLAGPLGWKTALEENRGLKVNIGHFGGDSKVGGEQWTPNFLQLMSEHTGLRGDIGYWDRLFRPAEVDRFKEFLNRYISPSENGSHRILYGSDWFMNSKDEGWQNYLQLIYNNLAAGGVTETQLIRVFYSNAKSFFDLETYIQ